MKKFFLAILFIIFVQGNLVASFICNNETKTIKVYPTVSYKTLVLIRNNHKKYLKITKIKEFHASVNKEDLKETEYKAIFLSHSYIEASSSDTQVVFQGNDIMSVNLEDNIENNDSGSVIDINGRKISLYCVGISN